MGTKDFLVETIEDVFDSEEISTELLTAYISSSGVLFGICEESEDLTILEKSYEQQSK